MSSRDGGLDHTSTGGIVSTHDDSVAPSLPPATSVGRVALQVSDLQRSLSFYQGLFGMRITEVSPMRVVLGAEAGATLLELHTRPGVTPARPKALGLYHFAILLPDRAALGRLIRHLAEQRVPIGASDHLVSEAIYLHDPDGLGIEVYADRPRSQWRTHDGELAMATDPLDMDSLLAEAGPERWEGMPSDTTIGHMHLHVGDLVRAREFYHDLLGLDITVSRYPGALFLSAGGYHHRLGVNTWAGPHAAPPPEGAARLLFWELVVPGANAAREAAERFAAAATPVSAHAADTLWEVADPWRTVLHIRSDN